ncbi:MAG: alpha/beta hydrolase, partial [Planctomycetota bacterium]
RINSFGTVQSPTAADLSPISFLLNSSQYNHSDFLTADDAQAGARTPGQAGASLVSNTLIDWLLARSEGRAPTPKPKNLGVVQMR